LRGYNGFENMPEFKMINFYPVFLLFDTKDLKIVIKILLQMLVEPPKIFLKIFFCHISSNNLSL